MQTGDNVSDKNTEEQIAKKFATVLYGSFKSNTVLDVNNSVHMETLAGLQEVFRNLIKRLKIVKVM